MTRLSRLETIRPQPDVSQFSGAPARPQIIQIRGSLRLDLRRRTLFGDLKLGPDLKRVSDRAERLVEPAET